MAQQSVPVPTAHVDDDRATTELTDWLEGLHGAAYTFDVDDWAGERILEPHRGRVSYYMVIEAEDAGVTVTRGDSVRGRPPAGPYEQADTGLATATAEHEVPVWPGDVLALRPGDDPVRVTGTGTYVEVGTEVTPYPVPQFCFLRHIEDDAAGCAEYENAFRREVLPPVESDGDGDARGVNRINQHTIDMRHDREPTPVQHCHAPVTCGDGRTVPHTETAIVLDRSTYDLPPVSESDPHVRLFRRPHDDPTDWIDLPVEPGSVIVTPATDDDLYGHCFRNTFAILIAIPSFTAPLIELGTDRDRAGDSHRKYHE